MAANLPSGPEADVGAAHTPARAKPFEWPPTRRDEAAPQRTASAPGRLDPADLPAPKLIARSSEAGEVGTVVVDEEPDRHGGWWAAVERTWLDVTAPPLLERAFAAGWTPDQAGDYCHRCGGAVSGARTPAGCRRCHGSRLRWERLIRLGSYEPPLSRWVQDVKFTRWRRLGSDLGRWLGERVAAEIEGARAAGVLSPAERPVVVPVPMSLRRRFFRGIDHARVIADGVASVLGAKVVPALRREHRASQLEVPVSQRRANLSGAFHARRQAAGLTGRLLIVVDDVTTTGATLAAACRALSEAVRGEEGRGSCRIWAAVVARTPEEVDDRLVE